MKNWSIYSWILWWCSHLSTPLIRLKYLSLPCISLLYTFDWLLYWCPSSPISNRTNMMPSKCFICFYLSHSTVCLPGSLNVNLLFELSTVSTLPQPDFLNFAHLSVTYCGFKFTEQSNTHTGHSMCSFICLFQLMLLQVLLSTENLPRALSLIPPCLRYSRRSLWKNTWESQNSRARSPYNL